MAKKLKTSNFFNISWTILIFVIIFGVTLVFSTATRSVFEVNKLGIFKIACSLMGIFFAYDQLLGESRWFYSFKKHKFINSTFAILWLTNVLSTLFSKHLIISIYGSYDRWEGLITYSFYLFFTYLVANLKGFDFIKKTIWAIVIAAGLSSLYGIVQSLGIDIVQWSMDPHKRVFASINNPVHYCAIMGMSIPIIIGTLFYIIDTNKEVNINRLNFLFLILYYVVISILISMITISKHSVYWIVFYIILLGAPYIIYAYNGFRKQDLSNTIILLFNTLLLTIYAAYISYSRATWLGLMAALGLMFITTQLSKENLKRQQFFFVFFGSMLLTVVIYLSSLFNLYSVSMLATGLTFLGLVIAILSITYHNGFIKNILPIASIILLSITQFFITSYVSIVLLLLTLGLIVYQKQKQAFSLPLYCVIMVYLFMNIQFFASSVYQFANVLLLVICLIVNEKTSSKKNILSTSSVFKWKLVIVAMLALVFIGPKTLVFLKSTITKNDTGQVIKNATSKVSSLKRVAIEGTARTSMWKSAIPWFKDHILFGSGLDTIKYYYPKYRRPEYGKLEGGHNYTPDRLHNEYLNTLATKGIIGFISYYLLFIGGIFISILLFISKKSSPDRFLLTGLMGGAFVYLGQVFFNFGVVATLLFFFLFIGLGIAIINNHETT